MNVELYILGEKVTMFDLDDTIKINRKVKDYRDIENIFSDYSESFTVPALPNNRIFKHYYDADVENGFDARVKQPAEIYVDQELFKRGSIQLKSVKIKKNAIENYTIQFFTELTQLIDTFGEDELSDLDWSEYLYDYTYANVKTGLQSGLFFNRIIYPLISYKRRFLYNTAVQGLDPEFNTDIALGDSTELGEGIDWRELKPAIQATTIFGKIAENYGLTFTGDIFQSFRFTRIYMNLVNGDKRQSETSTTIVEENNVVIPYTTDFNLEFVLQITPETGFENTEYGIRLFIDGQLLYDSGLTLSGTTNLVENFIRPQTTSTSFSIDIYTDTNFTFDFISDVNIDDGIFGNPTQEFSNTGNDIVIISQVDLSNSFQEFKVKDFIKAFVKAFNLVVIPLDATTIFFQSLNDWYFDGKIIDIGEYANVYDLEVSPGELISGLDMKYEKTETFLSAVFAENNNRTFGEIDIDFRDENGKVLNGQRLSVTLPFEKPIFENIGGLTYGYFVNRDQEEFNAFHSIFYAPVVASSPEIFLKESNGTSESLTTYRQPRTSFSFQDLALNFEIEIDEFWQVANTDTLYTRYYAEYVNDVFSPKRRNYKLEAKLPLHILKRINLNDRLLINNHRYVINSYQADLRTREVKFDLFNDIFPNLEVEIGDPILSKSSFLIRPEKTILQFSVLGDAEISTVTAPRYITSFEGKIVTIEVDVDNTGQPNLVTNGTVSLVGKSDLNFTIIQRG